MFRLIKKISYISKYGRKVSVDATITNSGKFLFGDNLNVGQFSRLKIENNGELLCADDVYFGKNVEVAANSILIDEKVSIQDYCRMYGNIKIGAFTIFGPNVYVSSGTHHFRDNSSRLIREQDEQNLTMKEVQIGEDCWIGINVVIMAGITIGRGAVIGANAVITKDVKPYEIVAGIPAKKIGERVHFLPKKSISAFNDEDLPYFYSGFSHDKLNKSRQLGGIFVKKDFSVAAPPEPFDKIVIKIKKLTHSKSYIQFGSEKIELVEVVQEITFHCKDICEFKFQIINYQAESILVEECHFI